MVTIAILGILVVLGAPAMKNWMDDSRVRISAEAIHAGIQLARAEAVRYNELVRFQLTSDLTSGCNLSSTFSNWIVSIDDPTSNCDAAPAPHASLLTSAAPRIIQKRASGEGGDNTITIKATGLGAARSTLTFNGTGRLSGGANNNIDTIEIPDPATAECQHEGGSGNLRCLRIRILSGGDAVICDPKVTNTADVRYCP